MLAIERQAFLPARLRTLVRMGTKKAAKNAEGYGARLDEAMTLARKDRKELAAGIGVSVQAIGMVLSGDTKALSAENSAKASRFLQVDSYWLATGEGEPRPPMMKERAALSVSAVQHAQEFDALEPTEKGVWREMVAAAKAVAAQRASYQHPSIDEPLTDEEKRLADGTTSPERQATKRQKGKKSA